MSQPGKSDRLTLILVPNETAPVKRYQVRRKLLRLGAWAGALVALVLVAGLVDWVRLRLEAVDVDQLRSETALQRERLSELVASVESLEADLQRIRDFETKVRVIADLPAAVTQVTVPETMGEGAEQGLPSGPAGGEGALAPLGEGPELLLGEEDPFDAAALARVRRRAELLMLHAHERGESFEDLVGALEGKSRQLASTPSIWPVDGWVTSGYGYRISPFTGRRKFHAGIDIAADHGTPILSPARGKVVFVGRKGPLGKTVILDHGYGIRTTYGHAAEILVEVGEEVRRGDRIATVGSTGRSTGPHLHYALARGGKSKNPVNYIVE